MSEVKIFFAGDFCSKPSTSLIEVSDELKDRISSCDLKVINFEVPLKKDGVVLPPYSRERFFQNDDSPEFLRNLGFNLFAGANNHALDQGAEGWLKTKAALGDSLFGSGLYDDAYKVKVVECNGFKIGFMALSYSAHLGTFNRFSDRSGYGCAYIDDLRVNHDIIQAKAEVDYLFVLPHAGIEYIDVPIPGIIARYRDFIDYGADGVIGSHPHCPQGWEEYKGKPVFYSLGNFFFNSKPDTDYRANNPHWYEGLCVEMTIDDSGMSYRTVNVKNAGNISLSVDHDPARDAHLASCRRYLQDKNAYDDYFQPILERKIASCRKKIGSSFKNTSVRMAFKELLQTMKKGKMHSPVSEMDYRSLIRAMYELNNSK